jgi:hypothetical protein
MSIFDVFSKIFRNGAQVQKSAEPRGAVRWDVYPLGPGRPPVPFTGFFGQIYESEPRTFQYVPGVNATIVPRAAYGLLPFGELRRYAETVPEVAMCVRLLIEEMKTFIPRIYDPQGRPVPRNWLVDRPDGETPWVIWLSRLLYNVLVYDAGCVFIRREGGTFAGLRVIDGSTIFPLIDERGETPRPPNPAFAQIIYGMPWQLWRSDQIWYMPRYPRPDAPYGRSPIEIALEVVRVLENMWIYEREWYTRGNMPDMLLSAPPDFSIEDVRQFMDEFDRALSGNPAMRRRIYFLPYGFQKVAERNVDFNRLAYEVALEKVALAFGIPVGEFGKTPGEGLGGRGYMEAMRSAFYRQGIAPLKSYIEMIFNRALAEMGLEGYTFRLEWPTERVSDPDRAEMVISLFINGLITLNQALSTLGYDPVEGGNFRIILRGGQPLILEDFVNQARRGLERAKIDVDELRALRRQLDVMAEMLRSLDRVRKSNGSDAFDHSFYRGRVQDPDVPMPGSGVNESRMVRVVSADGRDALGIFKPASGERDSVQNRLGGSQGMREEAVYLLDRALGFGLVPVTFVEGRGSVQLLVRGDHADFDDVDEADAMRAAVLDFISGQLDRHAKNFMLSGGRLVLIDNGYSFPSRADLPFHGGFISRMDGRKIPDDVLAAVRGIIGDEELWARIASLVGREAASLARERARLLAEKGKIDLSEFAVPALRVT